MNGCQGGVGTEARRLHILEQNAFELATIPGAIRINPTAAAFQSGTRLHKFQVSPSAGKDWQAEGPQPLWVIFGLQLNVGKNHTVAAKPALEAKTFGGRR